MNLSTKSRYGLKAAVDLAGVYGTGTLTLMELAECQGVSEAYLERILRLLRQADIVDSVRGVNGGYALKKDPSKLSVEEVLEALEGDTALTECVGKQAKPCKNACICSARPLFLTLQNRIDEVLKNTTIQDLLDENRIQRRRFDQ